MDEAPEQFVLIGEPVPVRVPAVEWAAWFAGDTVCGRYWVEVSPHLGLRLLVLVERDI
ncbi:hypothetical protein [Streptomyces sp. AJS327]|uniref:hypothetical protein n=1 Tax=Streptomyces sp. AJS327 TaxID=2545265 RepID=UPI0015DF7F35|nr:hypothetical protein [Streptomyces sp. AJS327]